MKRLHLHINVEDLDKAKNFYSALLGAPPTVEKSDYAKWMIDDPYINLAISNHCGRAPGIDHVGIQAHSDEELEGLEARLRAAEVATQPEPGAICCYANSNKYWTADPSDVVWEMFHTMGEFVKYGEDMGPAARPTNQQAADASVCDCPPFS